MWGSGAVRRRADPASSCGGPTRSIAPPAGPRASPPSSRSAGSVAGGSRHKAGGRGCGLAGARAAPGGCGPRKTERASRTWEGGGAMSHAFKHIRVQETAEVLRVTLDRPPLNVLNIAMMEEMPAAIERARKLPHLRALVLDAA